MDGKHMSAFDRMIGLMIATNETQRPCADMLQKPVPKTMLPTETTDSHETRNVHKRRTLSSDDAPDRDAVFRVQPTRLLALRRHPARATAPAL